MARILFAAICGLVLMWGFALPSCAGTAQERGNTEPRSTLSQPNEAIETATRAVEPVESKEYQSPCREGGENRKSDLCAQWKAADKAGEAARWAFWQTVLSALGLAGLLYSLHLTRQAVGAATDATDDAERALAIATRNADAAVAHVEIARVSAERQLRAYVHVERGEIRWGNQAANNPQISLWVKNTGQTPARWFGMSAQIVATDDLHGVDEAPFDAYAFDPDRFAQWPALGGRGDSLSVTGSRRSDAEIMVQAFEENLAIQIFGILLYETIDGELMESEFWFVSRPPHRFQQRLKDGVLPSKAGLVTYGQHEEVPRKMSRASRVLRVYRPSERYIPPNKKVHES